MCLFSRTQPPRDLLPPPLFLHTLPLRCPPLLNPNPTKDRRPSRLGTNDRWKTHCFDSQFRLASDTVVLFLDLLSRLPLCLCGFFLIFARSAVRRFPRFVSGRFFPRGTATRGVGSTREGGEENEIQANPSKQIHEEVAKRKRNETQTITPLHVQSSSSSSSLELTTFFFLAERFTKNQTQESQLCSSRAVEGERPFEKRREKTDASEGNSLFLGVAAAFSFVPPFFLAEALSVAAFLL